MRRGSPILALLESLCLVLALTSPLSGADLRPRAEALEVVEGRRVDRLGVDRFGNLWSWNQGSGRVQAISPAGALVASNRIGNAASVDFDPEWGWVWVDRRGRSLFVDPPSGDEGGVEIPLQERMSNVAWIADGRIAVSAVRAAYRVEVWDLSGPRRIATWGEESPILSRPGALRLRNFLLEYDFDRRILYTFESFTGSLEVFDHLGRLVRTEEIQGRDRGSLDSWLAKIDREKIGEGETQELTVSQWPVFALDSDGGFWLHEKCLSQADLQVLPRVELTSDGQIRRHELSLDSNGCCSLLFAFWGDRMILFREPSNPKGACTQVIDILNNSKE